MLLELYLRYVILMKTKILKEQCVNTVPNSMVMDVNVYAFRKSNSASAMFTFASFLKGVQLLNERICSSRSKFFLLRVDPIRESHIVQDTNREQQKLFSFEKW